MYLSFTFWILIIIAVSFSGLIFSTKFLGKFIEHRLCLIVTFAAGVFSVTAVHLIEEGVHLNPQLAITGGIVGFLLLFIVQKLIPESHHHHDSHSDHTHSRSSAIKILTGDGVHNFGDGIVLAIAFSVSAVVGVSAAISILIHEFVQEVSEYFVLRASGYNKRQAILKNFLISLAIIPGAIVGFLLGDNETIEVILLGFAGGMFLHVVFVDLLANNQHIYKKDFVSHILMFFLGAVIIYLVGLSSPGH